MLVLIRSNTFLIYNCVQVEANHRILWLKFEEDSNCTKKEGIYGITTHKLIPNGGEIAVLFAFSECSAKYSSKMRK
jgi:hypothetical protein